MSDSSSLPMSDSTSDKSSSISNSDDEYTYNELKIITSRLFKKYDIQTTPYCPHKKTKCNFIFPCCNMKFKCGKCHDKFFEDDSKNVHTIDKLQIKQVICDICNERQQISNKCIKCNTIFGKYYCEICKVFADNDHNFHCDKCKICIIGKKCEFKHCDTCKCCIKKDVFVIHKCIENRLESLCTICMDGLKNGDDIFLMSCNHSMHKQCYNEYIKTNYKCPECLKTIKDMTLIFKQMENQIQYEPSINPYTVTIICNDCNKHSVTTYHHFGIKCPKCNSFNSRIK